MTTDASMADRAIGPLVSVITIFLNEERFLAEAIESVVAQTHANWELFLCDDGSTDGSAAIARAWVDRHPDRIRYLTHPGGENRGMSATRNLGLQHSQGEYVAFLDGDDVFLPTKLERQLTVLQAAPSASMACSQTLYWHSWTEQEQDADLDRFSRLVGPLGRVVPGSGVLNRVLRGTVEAICTCGVLIRRDAVLRAGGFEPQFRGLFEDQAFFAKLLVNDKVIIMEECLDLYRQHADSCCAVATRSMSVVLTHRAAFLRWFRQWIEQHGAPASVRWTVALEIRLHDRPALVRGRTHVRERSRAISGNLVTGSFAVARRLLPTRLRLWLWERLGRREQERRLTAAARSTNGAERV
jgi:glycosyltransferase involved in cell wall biosynthesis